MGVDILVVMACVVVRRKLWTALDLFQHGRISRTMLRYMAPLFPLFSEPRRLSVFVHSWWLFVV